MRRRHVLGLGVAALVGGCRGVASGTPTAEAPGSGALTGRLLITKGGNFYTLDVGSGQQTVFHQFPKGQFAASPTFSRDGKKIVFTYYVPPTDPQDLGGSDLYVSDGSGSNARLLRAHDPPNTSFESPCWSADGTAVYATQRAPVMVGGQLTGEATTIQRIDVANPQTLHHIADGQSPSVTPDGTSLVYLTVDQKSVWHLWRSAIDGTGAKELLAGQQPRFLNSPQLTYDGAWIAFAGAGITTATSERKASPSLIARLIGPTIAYADGTPADIWKVRPDGTGLQQLTHTQDHTPSPAWSPDGRWIATVSEMGIAVFAADGQQYRRLVNGSVASSITWLPGVIKSS